MFQTTNQTNISLLENNDNMSIIDDNSAILIWYILYT